MSKSITARQKVQNQPGLLHAGVDLALEKNFLKVFDEQANRLDQFSFSQDRGGYDYCFSRLEGLRQKHPAVEFGGGRATHVLWTGVKEYPFGFQAVFAI